MADKPTITVGIGDVVLELVDLSGWIAKTFGLADGAKVRPKTDADRIHSEIVRRIAASRSTVQTSAYCRWTIDSDERNGDSWDAACGEKWGFTEGDPAENKVRFCQGCGRRVKVLRS